MPTRDEISAAELALFNAIRAEWGGSYLGKMPNCIDREMWKKRAIAALTAAEGVRAEDKAKIYYEDVA